ncbi:MAG: adenylate/guanylate cyclase domain-containing protein [Polyangiaceae bacterium]|nr:adenylate/guanylate cyclase domain-containing protein [Polyangiaceae bacterium]
MPPRRAQLDRPAAMSVRSDLASAVSATMQGEARANEIRIGRARVVALVLIVAGDWARFLFFPELAPAGPYAMSQPLLSTGWLALSLLFLLLLRRGFYRRWLRFAVPVGDAAFVQAAHLLFAALVGWPRFGEVGSHVSLGLGFVVTIGASALRYDRLSTLLTMVLAAVGFTFCAAEVEPLASAVYQLAFLLAAGVVALWTTGVVARAAKSEVARLTLLRFLPARVVDGAHRDPVALLTAPRQVEATVLVSDLRDFTALSEALPPAELFALLSALQGQLAAAVRRHGGTVDKFMGDGMLAVFGAPEPLSSHAACAVDAARDMRRALAELNAERTSTGRSTLRLGIGIHTGPVLVGCVGTAADLEFTVIGDTVNTAARLESMTKEHGVDVLLSDETAARVPGLALCALGELGIRGKRDRVRVHALAQP